MAGWNKACDEAIPGEASLLAAVPHEQFALLLLTKLGGVTLPTPKSAAVKLRCKGPWNCTWAVK